MLIPAQAQMKGELLIIFPLCTTVHRDSEFKGKLAHQQFPLCTVVHRVHTECSSKFVHHCRRSPEKYAYLFSNEKCSHFVYGSAFKRLAGCTFFYANDWLVPTSKTGWEGFTLACPSESISVHIISFFCNYVHFVHISDILCDQRITLCALCTLPRRHGTCTLLASCTRCGHCTVLSVHFVHSVHLLILCTLCKVCTFFTFYARHVYSVRTGCSASQLRNQAEFSVFLCLKATSLL